MELRPRVAALNDEEVAAEPRGEEEHDFYWEEIENLQTGEINMIKRREFVPKGSNPRQNLMYSTGTVGRRNYNLYQQYLPKTITKSTIRKKYNQI